MTATGTSSTLGFADATPDNDSCGAELDNVVLVPATISTPSFTQKSPVLKTLTGTPYSAAFFAVGAPAYSLPGAPSWLSVNAYGAVTGTPPAGTTSFTYSVKASNADGSAVAGPYTVAVETAADISGTVTDGGLAYSPVAGATVQACVTGGGECQQTTTASDGSYTVPAPISATVVVSAYPLPGSSDATTSTDSLTVPASGLTGENISLDGLAPLPNGTTVNGTTSATVFWGNPATIATTGCADGLGLTSVIGENTESGQYELQLAALPESPVGSGVFRDHPAAGADPRPGHHRKLHRLPAAVSGRARFRASVRGHHGGGHGHGAEQRHVGELRRRRGEELHCPRRPGHRGGDARRDGNGPGDRQRRRKEHRHRAVHLPGRRVGLPFVRPRGGRNAGGHHGNWPVLRGGRVLRNGCRPVRAGLRHRDRCHQPGGQRQRGHHGGDSRRPADGHWPADQFTYSGGTSAARPAAVARPATQLPAIAGPARVSAPGGTAEPARAADSILFPKCSDATSLDTATMECLSNIFKEDDLNWAAVALAARDAMKNPTCANKANLVSDTVQAALQPFYSKFVTAEQAVIVPSFLLVAGGTLYQLGGAKLVAAATIAAYFYVSYWIQTTIGNIIESVVDLGFKIARCPVQPDNVKIDPSGTVLGTNGHPVKGATVTILRADTAAGPFTPEPAPSPASTRT